MFSQETIDEVRKIYDQDPERIKRFAKYGDMIEKATAQVILQIISEGKRL